MTVTVSAPGKIFLMGEHAVVYGKPAVISCINKRITVTVKSDTPKTLISSSDNKFIKKLIEIVTNYYHLTALPPFEITVTSEIKKGYHLGSSASVSVAVIAALIYLFKKIWHPEVVNQLAFQAEKIKHGTPSGADNSAVTFGGFIWYRYELDFLKSIWQMPLKLSPDLNHFYLADTGLPAQSTYEMVAGVAAFYKRNKKKLGNLFNINEECTKNIARALKDNDRHKLIKFLRLGQSTLEEMGVVSDTVIPFIRRLEKSGGAAKILGGGGRQKGVGYLLCFSPRKDLLAKSADHYGFALEKVILGEEGVRLEKKHE